MGHEAAVLKSLAGPTASLLGVNARGKVDGLVFELEVEQRYRNAASTNIEVVYTFPIPWGAALLALDVRIGERSLTGVVVEKRTAESQYEEAIDKGDTAIMLERASDGLYTLNLGNLMPGEEATIRYVYAQTLRYEQGSARLVVPTVIAPRFGDPAHAGFQPHQVPAHDLSAEYPLMLTIELRGFLAKGRLSSPSHPIALVAAENGVAVTLARTAYLDRDFVLMIEGLKSESSAVLAKDGEGYVALASFYTAVPSSTNELPMRLKLLVDCSRSMAGDSIGAAKRALHRILEALDPTDQFSLSIFGNDVVHLVGKLTAASSTAIGEVAAQVGGIDAKLGGTEMAGALKSVFQLDGADEGSDVLLISDGEITAADELVTEACRAGQRVFVVGIGSAPAEAVLRRLAEATGGACEFVAPNQDVEAAILRMFGRLRSPRVERIDIIWPQPPRWTTPLPHGLFGGETIHIWAGFDELPAGEVAIELRSFGDGASLKAEARLPAQLSNDTHIPRMAAMARIPHVDAAAQLRLALDYHLLTDRTNLVAVHARNDEERATQLPALEKIAQMHAAGWGGVGGVLAAKRVSNRLVDALAAEVGDFVRHSYNVEDMPRADEKKKTEPAKPPTIDWTPVVRALDAQYTASWLGKLPRTFEDLRRAFKDLEQPGATTELWSEMAVARLGFGLSKEYVIVNAFLVALEPWAIAAGASRQLLRALRKLRSKHYDLLYSHIAYYVGKPPSRNVDRVTDATERIA